MVNPQISVIVITRNRPKSLSDLLLSIQKSTFKKFELIVIDQSDNSPPIYIKSAIESFKKATYILSKTRGKSKSLNEAMRKSSGKIIAFTDDDCIIKNDWLATIHKHYQLFPNSGGIFGNTYPYQPKRHQEEICPATFVNKKMQFIADPFTTLHEVLGQGNNMSIRRSLFTKIGYFREWLGTGSISHAAEDNDIVFRILLNGYKICVDPKMVVYHNRWLTTEQDQYLQMKYTCGILAFGLFNLIKTRKIQLIRVIAHRLKYWTFTSWKNYPTEYIKPNGFISLLSLIRTSFQEVIFAALGLSLGFIYSFLDQNT